MKQHTLSDWLALHGLDAKSCRCLLDAIAAWAGDGPSEGDFLSYQAVEPAAAWQNSVDAMCGLLPEQRSIIEDTYKNSTKIRVDGSDKARKSFTLDNGPGTYPTIVYSYHCAPRDCLVIAHEFAHALQIRASGGEFVAPIMREICAFLGEAAFISHTLRDSPAQHAHILQAWRQANHRYFGRQRERLETDLSRVDAPYKYYWNYPIARYLAVQISNRCPADWIWNLFKGEASVIDILRELRFPMTRN